MNKILLFEEYITLPVEDITDLEIDPDWRVPQVGSKRFDYDVVDHKFVFKVPHNVNEMYDFVVTKDGKLLIGYGHYKLSKKQDIIKAAGRIKIDENGKINYIDNVSGHYRPTQMNLAQIADLFMKMNLTADQLIINKKY